MGQPWLQRDQEIPSAEGLGERSVLGTKRGPEANPEYEVLERYESSDLEALKTLLTDQYAQWKDVVTLRRLLIYKEVNTPYEVVDELLPKQKQRPLNFKNLLCVARKPTVSAAGFDIAPDNARERRSDRFDQDAFDLAAEGNLIYALAVCVDAGDARVDLPQVPEDLLGGHAHLFGMRLILGHHVRHAPSLSSFQAGRAC